MNRYGLRTGLFAVATGFLLGLAAALGATASHQLRRALEDSLAAHLLEVARAAPAPAGNLHAALDALVHQTGAVYAAAIDPQTKEWVRTEHAPTDAELRELAAEDADGAIHLERLETADSPHAPSAVLDVSGPIREGFTSLHVGATLASVDGAVAQSREKELSAAVTLLALALLAIWWLLGRLVLPLSRLVDRASRLADGRPIDGTIPHDGAREAWQLADALSRLQQRFGNAPNTFRPIADELNAGVERVLSAARSQGELLDRQSAALQEAQVTAEEIRQVSLAAATSVGGVIAAAEQAEQLGGAGETALEVSVNELTAIRDQVEAISRQINALGERTTQIGAVTSTVKGLADQSSMLALNAAIEAVRAGRHGQGFSTVANEIRSLADQSIEATQRVRDLLEDVDRATREAVRFTEQGTERIDTGLKEIRTTSDTLRKLSTLVRQNAAAVRQIADSVGQQNAGISQLFEAIRDLGQMMEAGMEGLGASDQAAADLEKVARDLSSAVEAQQ